MEVDIGDNKWQPTGHTMVRDKGTKPRKCVSSYIHVYKISWIQFHFKTWRKVMNLLLEKWTGTGIRFFFLYFMYLVASRDSWILLLLWLIERFTRSFWNNQTNPKYPSSGFARRRHLSEPQNLIKAGRLTLTGTISRKISYLVSGGLWVPEGYPQTAWPWDPQAKSPCRSLQQLPSPGDTAERDACKRVSVFRWSWGVQSQGPGNEGLRSETNFGCKERFVML